MVSTSVAKKKDEEGNLVDELDKYRCRDSGDAVGNHTGAAGTVVYDISASAPTGSKIYPTRLRIRELNNQAGIVYIYSGAVGAANLIEETYLDAYQELDIVYEGRGGTDDIIIKSGTSTDVFCGADVMVDSRQRQTE